MGGATFNEFCAENNHANILPDPRIKELKAVTGVIIVIVAIIGITGNILNLFTLRSPSLQTVPFRYIRALAIFDLIGLTTIVFHLIFKFTKLDKIYPIAFYSVYIEDLLINSFLVAGLYCAVLLTVERYLLIRRPHKKRVFKISSVFAKICSLLFFSILIHCPMVLQVTGRPGPDGTVIKGNNKQLLCKEPYWTIYSYYGFIRESIRFINVFVLVALNIFIARQLQIAKKNRRLLTKRSITSDPDAITKNDKNLLMRSFTEKRLTALMVAICAIYMIGNFPQIVVMVFQNESTEVMYSFQLFRHIANTLEVLNHCLNFFIFCLASSEYTRAFLNSCPILRDILQKLPFCATFINSRRLTISDLPSESRATIIRRKSSYYNRGSTFFEKQLHQQPSVNNNSRRNTTATVLQMITTPTGTATATTSSSGTTSTSASQITYCSGRRKSTPPSGMYATVSKVPENIIKPSLSDANVEGCLVISNEFSQKKEISEISHFMDDDADDDDFRDGDDFL